MSHQPVSISACLIVKNEAHCLAHCLDSIASIVSEIIIVDTGSTDETVAIAQRYTDKIFHHPWSNHFAEARNVGLAHAAGDWILIIDADEVIPQETTRLIPSYISRPDYQNRPLVLNWLVRSPDGQGLFSRGLFPNGHGIHFAGRVHEIPVLVDRELPAYHCEKLVLLHDNPISRADAKQRYYQQLLKQNIAETYDSKLVNHLQKHLGMSHMALGEWLSAWTELSACYAGMQALNIRPDDGFYRDVLQGLVQTGQQLCHPNTTHYAAELSRINSAPSAGKIFPAVSKVSRKTMTAAVLCLLSACQPASVPPRTAAPSEIPLIVLPETSRQASSRNPQSPYAPRLGDFRIQGFCMEDAENSNACYAAGGHPEPVTDADGSTIRVTDTDGSSCYHFSRCGFDEMPTPTPTPTPIPTPLPTPTPPNSSNGSTSCDNAPALFPSQLAPVINGVQIGQTLSDIKAQLKDFLQADKRVQNFQDQINQLQQQAPTKSQQKQLTNLQQKLTQAQSDLNQSSSLLLSSVQQVDQKRFSTKQEIQQWDSSFSDLPATDPPLSDPPESDPSLAWVTFGDYKDAIAGEEEAFTANITSKNTFDLVAATSSVTNEMDLLSHLTRALLNHQLPLDTSDESPDNPDEALSQIQTPQRLIRYLCNHISQHFEKLIQKNSDLQQDMTALIQKSEALAINLNQLDAELEELVQQVRAAGLEINIDDLREAHLDYLATSTNSPEEFHTQQLVEVVEIVEEELPPAMEALYAASNAFLKNPTVAQNLAKIAGKVLELTQKAGLVAQSELSIVNEKLKHKENLFPEEIASLVAERDAIVAYQQKLYNMALQAQEKENRANEYLRQATQNLNTVKGQCLTCVKMSEINWKGFSKGELQAHYQKHVVELKEFGNITQNQYLQQAKNFAKESKPGFQEGQEKNILVKYDPSTGRTIVANAKDREIRTFYIADNRSPDPFADAMALARTLTK